MATEKTFTLSAVVATAAERSGKNPDKVGKEIRARIRRNFDDLQEVWPQLEDKENRDGNRYPVMPAAAAKELLAPYTK